jgi:hypothetical protein
MADANVKKTVAVIWIFIQIFIRIHLSPVMANHHIYSRLCQHSITRNSRGAIPTRNYTI